MQTLPKYIRLKDITSSLEKKHMNKLLMKKQFVRFVIILVATISFSSCTDVVKVDLKEGQKLLVVDAWVNNGNNKQVIRLTNTDSYFSNVNTPPVAGAQVSVHDITTNQDYVFADEGNGNYAYQPAIGDGFAQVKHQYQLKIQWQGYNYAAYATLNRTTQVDTILWRDEPEQPGLTGGLYPYVVARDAVGAKDFYWVKSYQNNKFFSDPSLINVLEDAGGGDGTDGLFFIPPNAYFAVTPGDKPYKVGDSCYIEIHSISREAFDFWIQAQKQMTNSQAGLFANTPENVRTNIETSSGAPKAIGWFNMAALSTYKSYAKK